MGEQSSDPGDQIRLALLQRLESLQRSGVRQLARPPVPQRPTAASRSNAAEPVAGRQAASAPPETPPPTPARGKPVATPPPVPSAPARAPDVPPAVAGTPHKTPVHPTTPAGSSPSPLLAPQRVTALDVLRNDVAHCARCAELAAKRTQTVFGVGQLQPRLCFLGEAPGEDEDRQGEPFVGRAGQLLNKIIEACTWQRQDVYILNVLKCRPPNNRNPLPEEVANCRGYFERQLDLLQPEFICCLGAVAAHALLRTTRSVGQLRGRFHDYRGAKVLVTYHPSYLLRTPEMKKETWEDMKRLMREMGSVTR